MPNEQLTWHEIDKKKISITKRAAYEWQRWKSTKRKARYSGPSVEYRPATIAEFTIGELQYILNQIQRYPLKEEHSIVFSGERRYKIYVYVDTDEKEGTNQEAAGENS